MKRISGRKGLGIKIRAGKCNVTPVDMLVFYWKLYNINHKKKNKQAHAQKKRNKKELMNIFWNYSRKLFD